MMLDGEAVLSCCKNGAHRSATETTIVVMRVTGWDAQRSANYVSQLRNLVDLDSTAPPSAFRRVPTKPIEFLKRNQDRILEGSLNLAANTVVTPIQFRSKARDLGFETKGAAPEDDGLRPRAKAMPAMPRTAGNADRDFVLRGDQRTQWQRHLEYRVKPRDELLEFLGNSSQVLQSVCGVKAVLSWLRTSSPPKR